MEVYVVCRTIRSFFSHSTDQHSVRLLDWLPGLCRALLSVSSVCIFECISPVYLQVMSTSWPSHFFIIQNVQVGLDTQALNDPFYVSVFQVKVFPLKSIFSLLFVHQPCASSFSCFSYSFLVLIDYTFGTLTLADGKELRIALSKTFSVNLLWAVMVNVLYRSDLEGGHVNP